MIRPEERDLRTLGEAIRLLRSARGYTPSEFGAVTGVSAAFVASWERGDLIPSATALRLMATVARVHPETQGITEQTLVWLAHLARLKHETLGDLTDDRGSR